MKVELVYRDYYQERKKRRRKIITISLCLLLMGIIFLAFSCTQKPVWADVIDMRAIMTIESNGNPNAIGTSGEVGLYQIMPCVLAEYNQFNKVNLQRSDLFNPLVNEQIARWYLGVRLPQMLSHYHRAITTNNVIWAYNAGIGKLVRNKLPRTTKNYIADYARLARTR